MSITTIWKGKNEQTLGTSAWFMKNVKVIIFHLLNYTWPLIPKLQGKTKQKLAILFSCYMTVSHMTVTWHFCYRKKIPIQFFLMLFKYGEALIRFKFWQYWYLNTDVLKMYFLTLLTKSTFRWLLLTIYFGKNNMSFFEKFSEKRIYA